jgi:hypothetical protein
MVVADGDALACEVAEVAAVDFMANQQHHTLAASPKLPLLGKEGAEVVRAESLLLYAAAALGRRRAAHKLGAM